MFSWGKYGLTAPGHAELRAGSELRLYTLTAQAEMMIAQRSTDLLSACDVLPSCLCEAGKTPMNLRKGHVCFAAAQGDSKRVTKEIWFQPPIEVNRICAPQSMKVFRKFQP